MGILSCREVMNYKWLETMVHFRRFNEPVPTELMRAQNICISGRSSCSV